MAGCCDCGNEPSGSTNFGKFFGYLKICWLLYGVIYFQSPIVNFEAEISFTFEGDFCIPPAIVINHTINCKLLK